MKKVIVTLLTLCMVISMAAVPVSAEGFSVTATTPDNGARLVSAVEDVVITFSEEPDADTLAAGISVSPSVGYDLKKSKNRVLILFTEQLKYLTTYTVTVDEDLLSKDGAALSEPYTLTFKTEYDPIKTLYYNDFEDGADSLAKFVIGEDQRPVTAADGFYSIETDPSDPSNHVLRMTPAAYASSFGYYPVFKDSQNWIWYDADYSLKQGDASRIRFLIANGSGGKIVSNPSDIAQRSYTMTMTAINQNARYCKAVNESTNGAAEIITNQSIGTNNHTVFSPARTERMYSGGSTQITQTVTDRSGDEQSLSGTGYVTNGVSGLFAIAEGSQSNDSWVDDIVVTDLGWYPHAEGKIDVTPNRKNIEDGTIKLYFENNIYEHTGGSQSITVKDEQGNTVDRTVTVVNNYPRHVLIKITDPKPYTTYTITVPQDSVKRQLATDAYAGFLANDKVFTVKTPYKDFSVVSTSPLSGAENVSVNSGLSITFSDAVDLTTLPGNITVSGAPSFSFDQIDDKTVVVNFASKLKYGAEYNVRLSSGILSENGDELSDYSFSFKTEESNFRVSSEQDGNSELPVVSDIVLDFNDDIDWSTFTAADISVSPAKDFTLLKIDDRTAKVLFDRSLDYFTDYQVTVGGDIASLDETPLSEKVISFRTAPDMGRTLFYENFDGDPDEAYQRFEEIGSDARHESENFSVENGALKLPSYYSGAANQAEKTMPKIIGSDAWKDYEIMFDSKIPSLRNVATSAGASVTCGIRYGTYGQAQSFVSISQGDSANNGKISARVARDGQVNYDPYIALSDIPITDYDKYMHTDVIFEGGYNDVDAEYKLTVEGNTYSDTFSSKTKSEDFREAYIIPDGGIFFSTLANSYASYVDNILIYDREFYYTVDNVKNTDGSITLTFNKAINQSSAADNIKVYDEFGGLVNADIVPGVNKVTVTIPDAQSGEIYRIKALAGLTGISGETLKTDRYTDISVLKDFGVMNLDIRSGSASATSLTAGGSIFGSCDVFNEGTTSKPVTLILAVYDENGALYAIKTIKSNVGTGTKALKTEAVTLPANVSGYTASVFCWDDLVNIKPVSSVYSI